jgi:hypothetical protein
MELVMLVHGSRDPEYLNSVREFSQLLGVGHSLMLNGETHGKGLTFPLFIEYGDDYERALAKANLKVKPLLEWPGFIETLRENVSGAIVMHGSRNPRFREELSELVKAGLKVYLLVGEPNISSIANECPSEVYLLFLFRGVIFNRAAAEVKANCGDVEVKGPLYREPWFISYLKANLGYLSLNGIGNSSLSL